MRLQDLQQNDDITDDDRETFTGTIRITGDTQNRTRVQCRTDEGELLEFYCSKPTAPEQGSRFYLRAEVAERRRWRLPGREAEDNYMLENVHRLMYSSDCFECGKIVVISRTVRGRRGEIVLLEKARPYHEDTVEAEVAPEEMETFREHEC